MDAIKNFSAAVQAHLNDHRKHYVRTAINSAIAVAAISFGISIRTSSALIFDLYLYGACIGLGAVVMSLIIGINDRSIVKEIGLAPHDSRRAFDQELS